MAIIQAKRTLLSLSIVAVMSSGAIAAESAGGLEEVVVTAERVEASLQDTPISLSVFDKRTLASLGVIESGDIAPYSSNLRMDKTPASQNAYSVSIRGVSSADPSLAVDPTVGIYVDGIYLGRNSAAAFEIVDLERVEVLRGPQGTLYGRNTTGGAINLVTAKPTGEFGFTQKVTVGERDLLRSSTSIDTPAFGDVAAKISFIHGERGGLAESLYTGGELGQYDQQAWRIGLRWTPSEHFIADYSFDHFQQDSNTNLSQITHVRPLHAMLGGAQYEQAAAVASRHRSGKLPYTGDSKDQMLELDGHALTLSWEVGRATVKSISSWREFTNRYDSQGFGEFAAADESILAPTFDGTFIPAGTYVQMFESRGYNKHEQWSQEFQMIGSSQNEKFQYTVGAYFFNEKGRQVDPQEYVFPALLAFDGLDPAITDYLCSGSCFGKSIQLQSEPNKYDVDNDALALYGQFEYAFTDKLRATLGMRWSQDKKTTKLTNNFTDLGLVTLEANDTWEKFNPNLTLTYTFDDDFMMYAKVATGYRAGGYNIRAVTPSAFADPADEENIISWELGTKSEWLDNRVRLNGAVFYYEYKDQQVTQFEAGTGGASSRVVNAGESDAWGAEIELTIAPTENWLAILNYGYTDLSYNEFISSVNDPETGFPVFDSNGDAVTTDISHSASTIAGGPKTSASAILQYSFPVANVGLVTAQVDASYSGKRTFTTQLNWFDAADAYTLYNARIGLSEVEALGGKMSFAMWGRNLGNEEVREFGIDFGALGYAVNTYRELRSVGLDISYQY